MACPRHTNRPRPPHGLRGLCMGTAFVAMTALAAAQQAQPAGQQQPNAGALPGTQAQEPGPSRPAAGASPLAVPAAQGGQRSFDAANAERRKPIAIDSARLLELATELKADVDKTNKDTLSLTVVRKADAIEKLARAVKENMKLALATN